jgi:uncharacterized protein YegJ (DUF2314 family)
MLRALILSLGLAAFAGEAIADDSVWLFGQEDPVMNAAIKEARAHVDVFLDYATPDQLATGDVLVKYAAPVEGKDIDIEHIWVTVEKIEGDQITGMLANDPYDLDAAKGDLVVFDFNDVSDWSYWGTDGKLYGNYTTRVMLPQLSLEDQQYFQSILAPLPE